MSSGDISTSASIGQLLRAQFAMNNSVNEEKPKTVGFNESENMRLYELYSAKREEYHSTRPSGQRNEEVPMDTLAREWAAEITSMGFAERTAAQIKQRIRDMRKFSRKHAHKLGINGLNGSASSSSNNNTSSPVPSASGLDLDKLSEYNWAETKRRSRGPVPDWMSGLAQIMMTEQEKNQEEADVTSDVMDAAFGPKAKRLRLAKNQQQQHQQDQKATIEQQLIVQKLKEQQLQQQQKQKEEEARKRDREIREMSPETALIEKKLQLADAKLESERLRQQALRLEISYYQRQTQLYEEQLLSNVNELTTSNSPVVDFLNFRLTKNEYES